MQEKVYYRIGEVAKLLDVKPSVLRYWEKAFVQFVKPIRNLHGDRLYQQKDIEFFRKVHYYIKVEKLTIKGTIERLKKEKNLPEDHQRIIQSLYTLRQLLTDLIRIIDN